MTTVSVASGKGGAGKTSIAAALAVAIAAMPEGKCIFADCDVDAANGAIALDARERERSPYFAGPGFSIKAKACTACGRCILTCRFDAIRKSAYEQSYVIVPELCERCGACLDACPRGAVTVYEKQSGEFFVADTALGPILVYAELEPGEDTSGKLVRIVRDRAGQLASKTSVIVVDSAPGIGCPVIASLSGADLVIIVVEASVSGIRDARRLVDLVRSMKRKAIAVMNKTGLSAEMDARARTMLAETGIPLAGEIPFDPALRAIEESGNLWVSIGGETGDRVAAAIKAVLGVITAIQHKAPNAVIFKEEL